MTVQTHERIAIIDGVRTPMQKAGTGFKELEADVLGAIAVREIVARCNINAAEINEVILGCVAQPVHAANVARVIALKAGIPESVPAISVHRNCASGMESITQGMNQLWLKQSDCILAGGVESMSNIPLLFNKDMTALFSQLMMAKSPFQALAAMARFRPRFLKPIIGLLEGLKDPVCAQLMGMTAENLAREFKISRAEQDRFALQSHLRALDAREKGLFDREIMPVAAPPRYKKTIDADNGPRDGQNIEALQKLRPYFDKRTGTVTVGSSSQVTDGAAAVILMRESDAKAKGHQPLGYLRDFAYAGCEPHRMGLGPTYAISKLFQKTKMRMTDIDLFEINEAFAAQVLANVHACDSDEFAKKELGLSQKLGQISEDVLNVKGGAIALGHPLAVSGTRIIITLLNELKRQNKSVGLASLCVGGGQGGAVILEAN